MVYNRGAVGELKSNPINPNSPAARQYIDTRGLAAANIQTNQRTVRLYFLFSLFKEVSMKLSQAADLFMISMETVRQDTTIEWYRKKIFPLVEFLEDPEVDQVDLFALERYRQSLNRQSKANGRKGKVSVYTVHGYVRAIKRFFNYLRKRRIININPAEDLEKPRLPKQPRKGISPEAAAAA